MQSKQIKNTVVDEAHDRTYIVLAPRVLSDGEIYKAIRQEILRRGGRRLARGETITLTVTASGFPVSPAPGPEPQKAPASPALPTPAEREATGCPPSSPG